MAPVLRWLATAALAQVVALAVAMALSACGESKQAKAFRVLEGQCAAAAANGWTLDQAQIAFSSRDVGGTTLGCSTDLGNLPPPAADTCGSASAATPVCELFWEWEATDSALCNLPVGGCCLICEVRVKKADLDAQGNKAVICASRAAQGQVCQAL